MAKDPAFLFYPSDFLTGCQDLTMEERGVFITLLCLEHQKGRLTEKIIRLSCGNATADATASVMAKFRQDPAGLWYNERLEKEIEKRAEFSQKQRERASNGWKTRKGESHGNATAMPIESINTNGNRIEIEEKKQSDPNFQNQTGQTPGLANIQPIETLPRPAHWPDQDTVEQYFISKGSDHKADQKKGAKFFHHYEAQSWHTSGGMPVTRWRAKADEWISSSNKFDTPEKTKVEITPDDYAEIPKTSSHYVRAN